MASETIQIVIQESGSRVVVRNFKDMSSSAREAKGSIDGVNNSIATINVSQIDRANNGFKQLNNTMSQTLHRMKMVLLQMAAIAGTTISASAIVHAMDAYTGMQNKLKIVAESQQAVNMLTEEMFRIANKTRMSVEETTATFVRFDLALKGLGKSQEDSLRLTETINKMIMLTSKGPQEAAGSLLQLSQAFNKGKLDGEEFRTVMETMPLFANALAKELGVTRGELLKLAPLGKITSEIMLKATQSVAGEVDKLYNGMKYRVSDGLTIMKNNWTKFWGELDSNVNISPKIASAIIWISENFKTFAAVGVGAIAGVVSALNVGLLPALSAVWAAIAANPFALLTAAIVGTITYLLLFEDEIRNSNGLLADFGTFALDAIDAVVYGWTNLYNVVNTLMTSLTDTATTENTKQTQSFLKNIGVQQTGFWGLIEMFAAGWDMAATVAAAAFDYIYKNGKVAFENLFQFVNTKVQQIANAFKSSVNNLWGAFGQEGPFTLNAIVTPEAQKYMTFAESVLKNQTQAAQSMVQASAAMVKADAAAQRAASKIQLDKGSLRGADSALQKQLAEKAAKDAAKKDAKKKVDTRGTKDWYRNQLNIKKGAEAGGSAQTGTYAAAYALKQLFGNNVVRFGAFNDLYHKGKNSKHNQGLAFDATPLHSLSRASKQAIASNFTSWMKEQGFTGVAKFERGGQRNKNGTVSSADHIHFQFGSVAEARRFQDFMQAMVRDGKKGGSANRLQVANKEYESALKQVDAYEQITSKMQDETVALERLYPLRLADQKAMEAVTELRKKDVELTDLEVQSIQQLAASYEEAYKVKALGQYDTKLQQELDTVKAVTLEEKAQLQVEQLRLDLRNQGIALSDQELEALTTKTTEYMKALEITKLENSLVGERVAKLDELAMKQQVINDLMARGEIGQAYGQRQLAQTNFDMMRENQSIGMDAYGNPLQGFGAMGSMMSTGLDQLLEGYTGTLNDLSGVFGDFFTEVGDGFANTFGKAIVQGEDLGTALKAVGKDALGSLISALIKLGIQWAVTQLTMSATSKAAGATATAQAAAQGSAIAAAYTPAATMANVATFGGASAAGMTGMMAAVSLASAIPAMLSNGFQTGGYTGNMGVSEIAGVVHGREFVFDAQATERIGVHNLEALRRGGNMSSGHSGSVEGFGNTNVVMNVTVENNAHGVVHEVHQISENEIRVIAREESRNVLNSEATNPNSSLNSAIKNNYQVQRRFG